MESSSPLGLELATLCVTVGAGERGDCAVFRRPPDFCAIAPAAGTASSWLARHSEPSRSSTGTKLTLSAGPGNVDTTDTEGARLSAGFSDRRSLIQQSASAMAANETPLLAVVWLLRP